MKSNVEQAIESLAQLLTAAHDHGSWKPGIVISYLGPNFANGEGWYIALNEYRRQCRRVERNTFSAEYVDGVGYSVDLTPARTTIFKGKYETLREALKAAAEFLAPTKLDEMKARVQALAEKL
jgi:hypothetical protein